MATTTSNLGLTKPERSDNYNVDVMGENMDIIDERITALETTIPEKGAVEGFLFVKGTVGEAGEAGDETYGTIPAVSMTVRNTVVEFTVPDCRDGALSSYFTINSDKYGLMHQHTPGVYTRESDLRGKVDGITNTAVTFTIKNSYDVNDNYYMHFNYKLLTDENYSYIRINRNSSGSVNLISGETYMIYVNLPYMGKVCNAAMTSSAGWATLKVTYDKP